MEDLDLNEMRRLLTVVACVAVLGGIVWAVVADLRAFELGDHLLVVDDRPGDELREEAHKEAVVDRTPIVVCSQQGA